MYYAVGTLMLIIMTLGFSENFAILYTYSKNRKIQTVDNLFIVGIALSDFGQAVLGVPFVVISSFSKRWIFGFGVCQYYAFITTFLGISQVAMLTSLAVERYFVIVRCNRKLSNSRFRGIAAIACSFFYGLVWAVGPLVGWSSYEEESKGIACSVSWEIKDANNLSYTMALFTFGWFIPLFLIGFGYLSIFWTIYKDRLLKKRNLSIRKHNRDRKVAITVLLMIGAFVASWLPYSVVSMWSAVGSFKDIPTWAQVAPAVFAKCSIIWNPIIYVARHGTFRKAMKESICCFKMSPFFDKIFRSGKGKQSVHVRNKANRKCHENVNAVDRSLESYTSDNYGSCEYCTKKSLFADTSIHFKREMCTRTKSKTEERLLDAAVELVPMERFTEGQSHCQNPDLHTGQDNTEEQTEAIVPCVQHFDTPVERSKFETQEEYNSPSARKKGNDFNSELVFSSLSNCILHETDISCVQNDFSLRDSTSTVTGNATSIPVDRGLSREMCRESIGLPQISLLQHKCSHSCKMPRYTREINSDFKQFQGKYKNNESNSYLILTNTRRTGSEVEPTCRRCTNRSTTF